MALEYGFVCPLPTSANARLVRSRHGGFVNGTAYRRSLLQLQIAIRNGRGSLPTITGPAGISVTVHFPDSRRRDLDNVIKPLLDACTYAGVWQDDHLVMRLEVERGPVQKNRGHLDVRVYEMPGAKAEQ